MSLFDLFRKKRKGSRYAPETAGAVGENAAADYLRKAGYRILQVNYQAAGYEIDLIAENANYFIFCEVKARRARYGEPSPYGRPASAVTKEKQANIIAASRGFVRRHLSKGKRFRYDVIEVYLNTDGTVGHVHHIENAFRA